MTVPRNINAGGRGIATVPYILISVIRNARPTYRDLRIAIYRRATTTASDSARITPLRTRLYSLRLPRTILYGSRNAPPAAATAP